MIVYNTTFQIEKSVEAAGKEFLKKEYIPQAVASGFLMHPKFMRILTGENTNGGSYSVQFHVRDIPTLNFWIEHEGRTLQQNLIKRFGQTIVGFSTLLEEMDLK